jgi:2'-hydroxyisoflavone reductase
MTTRRDLLKLSATAMAAAPMVGIVKPAENITKAAQPLNILILGGTGFTGPNQVRYALARGHKITLFNRGRKPKEWPGEVEELIGDREKNELDALKGRKWDVCIDNPTSVPHWVRDVGKVLKGNVKQYVFISTISVYDGETQVGADESAPTLKYTGKNVYKETRETLMANMALYGPLKAACEAEAEKWFGKSLTIIRPGLIVGAGDETDRFSYWPLRVEKAGQMLAPPADDPWQFIDARDLAEWTIRMCEQRAFGTYNATGPDYELSTAAALYGMRACTTKGADIRFASQEFLAQNEVQPWSELPVWVPGSGDMAGFARRSIAKAKAKGLTFRSLADTTFSTLEWFHAQTPERQATMRAGLKPEREVELLELMRRMKSSPSGGTANKTG